MGDNIERIDQPDLEAEQVSRVMPVAQGVLEDMATMLIPEDGISFDLAPLELAIITRLLKGDLNITTEVPLAFQYVLSGITGLTQALAGCTYHEPHTQADYADASRRILAIMAKVQPKLGDTATAATSISEAKAELEALFAEKQLSAIDVRYIVNSIMSSFETVRNGAEKSIEESMERAQAKSFGVEGVQDVTMGKLDTYLQK
jgi:hypothetical protein